MNSLCFLQNRRGLTALLSTLCRLPSFLGESVSFGASLVEGSVLQCFSRFGFASAHAHAHSSAAVVDEDGFTRWLTLEPQILVR